MTFDLQTTFPTLRRAPIVEAVIDLKVELPQDVTLTDLAEFNLGMESRFPQRQERRSLQAQVEFRGSSDPKFATSPVTPDGFIFRAPGEYLVAQARLDGFTLSRLAPYHDGNTFAEQAKALWVRYVELSRPIKVTRIAVRNLNRIPVEMGSELQRYFLTGPEIARGLPQHMNEFLLRIVVPDPSGATAIITQTFGEGDPAGNWPIIFDVDAFREVDLGANSGEIWEWVKTLRRLKNQIFFKSLTAEALEMFR